MRKESLYGSVRIAETAIRIHWMLQDVPVDISERSSGIREERRRSRREFCICRITIVFVTGIVEIISEKIFSGKCCKNGLYSNLNWKIHFCENRKKWTLWIVFKSKNGAWRLIVRLFLQVAKYEINVLNKSNVWFNVFCFSTFKNLVSVCL